MKGLVLDVMNVVCALTLHARGCWVYNGAVGQRLLSWLLR